MAEVAMPQGHGAVNGFALKNSLHMALQTYGSNGAAFYQFGIRGLMRIMTLHTYSFFYGLMDIFFFSDLVAGKTKFGIYAHEFKFMLFSGFVLSASFGRLMAD
jgi:hypothetical protein